MKRTVLAIFLATALTASIGVAQPGMGNGPGYGGGCGAAQGDCGYGPGNGHGRGAGGGQGAGLMTPEERAAHRNAMHSLKSVDECKAYLTAHHAAMAERAKQLGLEPGPGPRADNMCERMAARGFFD